MNGILITDNYVIFPGDELTPCREWSWIYVADWKFERNVNDTSPNPAQHYREIFIQDDNGLQSHWDNTTRQNIRGNWSSNTKEAKDIKETYFASNELIGALREITKDSTLDNRITFHDGILSEEIKQKIFPTTTMWFIAEKKFLKDQVDSLTNLADLQLLSDGKEVISVKNGFPEVEKFIQDRKEIIDKTIESNKTFSGGSPTASNAARTENIKIKIDSILRGYVGNPHFVTLSTPIRLTGYPTSFYYVSIYSNSPLLAEGKEVVINNVSFGPGLAKVDEGYHQIKINNFFSTIEEAVTNSTPNPPNQTPQNTNTTNTNPPPPPTNPNPTFFAESQQKNQEIQAENINLALLAADLLGIIVKNNELCDKAKNEKGLDLIAMLEPDGSPMQLNDFNIGLEELEESEPLNSVDNQKVLAENAKSEKLKEDFAKSLKSIWQQNQNKFQRALNPSSDIPQWNSNSSLVDKKISGIFQIESRQVDLTVVGQGGKYWNYRQIIEGFAKEEEIENYLNEVLAAISQTKQEKENSKTDKKIPKPLLSEDEKSILSSSLETARQKAVAEIEKFLEQQGVKDSDWKIEKRGGKGYFLEFIKTLETPSKILEFVKNCKKEIEKLARKQEKDKNSNSYSPSNGNNLLIPVLVLLFVVFFSAALLIWVKKIKRLKRKHIK